ncbi:hypothetical protein LTR64_007343 [Lithohypha guttulata]|uniref:uncharacterized protein n=1 Tax=Lithohypha guttulata TaxID=1690604 RepID=UPI002DDF1727|nr:hypothetical protein LTR51_004099 [Lithohypha guttulata]
MSFDSREGTVHVPASDVVSFSFCKQNCFEQDQPLLVDAENPSRSLNYESAKALVRKLVAGFWASGLREGDSVMCHMSNTYIYPALFMGICGSAGVWLGSNTANQRYEIDHLIELGEPKFIITEPAALSTILSACENRQVPKENVFVLDIDTFQLYTSLPAVWWGCSDSDATKPDQAVRSFTDLLCHGEQDWKTIDVVDEAKRTPAAYFPTSGTTGLPKLAMVSHYNLVAHHLMLHEDKPYRVRRLMTLPLFHLFATSFAFIQPTRYGDTTYIMKRFGLESYLKNHDRYQITETFMTPPILMQTIASHLDVRALMRTVRWAGTGGAPCDAVSINRMRSLLTNGTMSQVWGLTECGVASMFRLGEHDETGSIGRLLRGYRGKLLNPKGELVDKEKEPGELYISSPGTMLGYRNMPSTEEESVVSDRGFRGWQVAPAELEAVLLDHSEIVDVAVSGTMAKNGVDEVPRAYVVRRKKTREAEMVTANEVYQFARERLASYKALDGGVCFVEDIPRTASGKIQRAKLTRMDTLRSRIAAVLSAAQAVPVYKQAVSEVKNAAMYDGETTTPRRDKAPQPRRSSRVVRRSSSTSEEASRDMKVATIRRVSTDSVSKPEPYKLPRFDKTLKKKQRTSKTAKATSKRLIKSMQASAA